MLVTVVRGQTENKEGNYGSVCGLSSIQPLDSPPLMVDEQDGAQLPELVRRIFERQEHDGALVEREREQLHLIGDGTLESVSQVVAAERTHETGEFLEGGVGHGQAGQHHPASLRGCANTVEATRS